MYRKLMLFGCCWEELWKKDAETRTAIKALTLPLSLMNNKAKAATGLSIVAVLFWLFHIFHVINFISNDFTPEVKPSDGVIILTDPAGKKDTIPLKEYLDSLKKRK